MIGEEAQTQQLPAHRGQLRRRRSAAALGLVGAALAGALITLSLRGGAAAPPSAPPPPVGTATLIRADLTDSVLTGGTLGYAAAGPLVNEFSGTYTELPLVGSRIGRGATLYRVDNLPVVLMLGGVPAWRPFAPGMTDGPDVSELQRNLIALGFAHGLLTEPTGDYDWATIAAVERWQLARQQTVTGAIPLGEVVFLPTAIRVGAWASEPGLGAAPGQAPYQVSTTARAVTVPLNPTLPSVEVGERVTIVLPSGADTPGRVSAIAGGEHSATGSGIAAVTPERPSATGTATGVSVQVSLTTAAAHQVLVAPVAALLALAGGGYGVEVVEPSGVRHLTPVSTGMFAGSQVQVSGAGVGPGTRVVVAQ